jgi:hypothetical protein
LTTPILVVAIFVSSGCAYVRVSADGGGGAVGPPPSSRASTSCDNLTDGTAPPVCGAEIQIPRPSTAPRSVTGTGVIGMTIGPGFRLARDLYLEPDIAVRAYFAFPRATATFGDAAFPGVTYRTAAPSNVFLFGLPIALQWRPVSRWSFSAGAGPAVALFGQDFSATASGGVNEGGLWTWTVFDALVRGSVEYDVARSAPNRGFDLRAALGVSGEADTAGLSRALLLNVSLYAEKTPIRGH